MSEPKATVLLEHYLKHLKLPSILREHEKMAGQRISAMYLGVIA